MRCFALGDGGHEGPADIRLLHETACAVVGHADHMIIIACG